MGGEWVTEGLAGYSEGVMTVRGGSLPDASNKSRLQLLQSTSAHTYSFTTQMENKGRPYTERGV